MKLSNKYAVGCHVMFYEIDMVPEYMESVLDAFEPMENPENITIDFCFNISQYFEKIDTKLRTKEVLIEKFEKYMDDMKKHGANIHYTIYDNDDVPYFMKCMNQRNGKLINQVFGIQ